MEGSEDVWLFQRDDRDPTLEVNMEGKGGGDWHTEKKAQSTGDNSARKVVE